MIRAGYLIDNQGYQSGTPDTYMSGWGYEYLQDISYHTEGWKYEYVLGTFSELIAKHEAGEIDLISSISYTPERAENLLYSTNPSGKKCYYVYVKPDRGDLTVGDPEALRGKTIGVNPDVLQTTEGKAWLAERGIDVTYKEYATGGEVFSALSSGEVDAIIMNDVLSSDDAMPVFYVGESDYYFTVPKSRPDIMAELDAAMAQILTSNPHYNDEFKARYSAINVGSSSLTDRERDWLASCDNTVTVGYLDNLRPYSLRGKDNQMEGALSAVVSDMRERFGITVNERAYSSNSDSEAALGRGEIDVALPFAKDYWIAEQEGYAQSDSLASSSLVALYKGDDLGSALSSILVQPNSIVSESLLRSRYPDADIIMCDNASACFDALSSGRAQAAIIPVMALDVVRSQNDLSAYKTAELPGTVRLTARMRQDAPTLLAIVNKSIANSQDNITAGIYTAQSCGETETTLVRFVRLYQGVFVAGVAVAFLGIMAILAWSLLRARKAQQEAQAASSAKTAFLSRMSHDIRTPLNGIIGILGVNEAHAEDAEYVSRNRKKARVAADHLLSLTNDVLDMSKIEDSKVVLEHKPFNVIDVIDEVLVVGRLRAPEFGVTIESIGAEDLVHTDVIGSPDHVRRVLLNLVDNAVKYNRLGGTVRCAVDELGVKGNIVTYRFVVIDTGVGMSEEFLKRIFEPFTQAGSDARSNYQGTGMGMPIVKGFVEKMDGSIDVTSTQGEGSSFCVVLPFEIDHAPERHAGSADAEGECDVSGMRVLLAEDNDLNLEIATTLLANEGVAVTCAANGREAFDTFVDRPAGSFDAILMDIMMPVMDGYEAACAIRRSVKADVGSVPIFAMTANAFAEDAQRAHDAGMNGHLTKPIDMEKVKQALATARR